MPSIVLKDEEVPNLTCPPGKRFELYYDTVMRGLAVQVTPNGVLSYVVQHRTPSGGKKQHKIGDIPKMTLPDAREQTVRENDKYLAANKERTKIVTKNTLGALFDDYIKAKNIIPENARRYKQALSVYGGPLWAMAIKEITPKAVLDQREKVKLGTFIHWHEKHTKPVPKAKGGPGCANDLIEYGSMVCSYAGLAAPGQNPFKGIDAFPTGEPGEKLVIEPALWPKIYKALQRRSYRERLVFWTACLMGARPLAAARMKWARLDLEKGSYHLTADKLECAGWKPSTSPEWKYPVDDWLLSMLREQKEWVQPDEVWVFPSSQSKKSGSSMGEGTLGRLFASLVEEGVLPPGMAPYSLRYTRGTYSETMFGDTLVVQRMLNHQTDWGKGQKLSGSALRATPGYIITLTNTVRPLVNKYATTIKQLCGIEPMSAETKKVFIDGEMLTIYQRREMAVEAGKTMFLPEAGQY